MSLYDLAFCINLDTRPDRWELAQAEFEHQGLEVERIPGVIVHGFDPKRNACHGCHLSHAIALMRAIEAQADSVLIFEDDVLFLHDVKPMLAKVEREIDSDWEMLYLGANIEHPMYQTSPHVARITGARSTHAYIARNMLFEKLLAVNEDPSTVHNDIYYETVIIPQHKCFITIPMLAVQREGYSDIRKQNERYQDWMLERYERQMRWLS